MSQKLPDTPPPEGSRPPPPPAPPPNKATEECWLLEILNRRPELFDALAKFTGPACACGSKDLPCKRCEAAAQEEQRQQRRGP